MQLKNERVLRKICADIGGNSNCQPLYDLTGLNIMRTKSVQPVTKYRGPLEIGAGLMDGEAAVSFDVWVYGRVVEKKPESFTKISLPSEDVDENDRKSYAKAKVDRTYKSLTEDDKYLEGAEMDKGYRYGRDLIPFSKVDQSVLKYEADKCLQVIGFVNLDALPRHAFVEGIDWVGAVLGIRAPRNLSGHPRNILYTNFLYNFFSFLPKEFLGKEFWARR